MNRKINILHITYSLQTGGLERFVLEFFKNINRRRFNPTICTFTGGPLITSFKEIDVPVYILNAYAGINFTLPNEIKRLIYSQKVDIIHTHNIGTWIYGGCTKFLFPRINLFHTEHSYHQFIQKKRLIIIGKVLSTLTKRIIAVNDDIAIFFKNKIVSKESKISTIYNGIDIGKYSESIDIQSKREKMGLKPNEKIIGVVARLTPLKDHQTLLKAVKKITTHYRPIRLLIIGDGELRIELEEYAKKLGILNNVKFLGNRDDVCELLKIIDVFVLTSLSEGTPMALLEAMASGLPIIATKVGGVPELICDNETGLLVPVKNPDILADKINAILNNNKLSKTLAENARKKAFDKFSIKRVVSEYERLYLTNLS